MNKTMKVLIVILLLGVTASFAFIQVKNKELFKGMLTPDIQTGEALLPDLVPSVEFLGKDADGNFKVKITIENRGEGSVEQGVSYSYGLFVNNDLIMTNTDSYLQMNPGDRFTFTYPIEELSDGNVIMVKVDEENEVEESNKDNNTATTTYGVAI